MTTPVIDPVPVGGPSYLAGQVPDIVSLTIREAPSLEHIVQQMRYWIANTLVPYINENIQYLASEWAKEVAELVAEWERLSAELVAQVEDIAGQAQGSADAAEASRQAAETAEAAAEAAAALAEMYASEAANIQDQAITTIFNNASSQFRQAADAAYVTQAELDGLATQASVDSVKADLEAEIAALDTKFVLKDSITYNVLDHGVVGDGVVDDSDAISALLNSVPNGATILFPSGRTFVVSREISLSAKSINIRAHNARFLYSASVAGFSFTGGFDPSVLVNSIEQTTVTPNSHPLNAVRVTMNAGVPATWRRGDLVRLYADDIIPGSRDSGDVSITQQGRVGEYLQVLEVNEFEAVLLGYLEDPFTIRTRIARLRVGFKVAWSGGLFDYTDDAMNETVAGNHVIYLNALYRPDIREIEIRRFPRIAVQVRDSYAWKIQGDFGYGINNLAQARYGYGVAIYGSCYGTLYNSRFGQVRHAYVNGHSFIIEATNSPTNRGRPHDNSIVNVTVESSTNTAFDSHTSGLRERFIGCYADNARVGFGLRGKNHLVEGCMVSNSGMAVSMIQEDSGGISEGHQINDLRAENVGKVFVSMLGQIAGAVTAETLVTVPTVINNVRARNVTERDFEMTYNTVHMTGWDVRRSPGALPAWASKSVINVNDYKCNITGIVGATNFLSTEAIAGGGDRNQVRIDGLYIKNNVDNLNYVVGGAAINTVRLGMTRVECDFAPVLGVTQLEFDKLSRRVYLPDFK